MNVPHLPQSAANSVGDQLMLSLVDHHIGLIIPANTTITGSEIRCDHGVAVFGTVIGSIKCLSGSIIVAERARVSGSLSAEKIYIAGTVVSPKTTSGPRRLALLHALELIALSSTARVNADLCAQVYEIKSSYFNGRIYSENERNSAFGNAAAAQGQSHASQAGGGQGAFGAAPLESQMGMRQRPG